MGTDYLSLDSSRYFFSTYWGQQIGPAAQLAQGHWVGKATGTNPAAEAYASEGASNTYLYFVDDSSIPGALVVYGGSEGWFDSGSCFPECSSSMFQFYDIDTTVIPSTWAQDVGVDTQAYLGTGWYESRIYFEVGPAAQDSAHRGRIVGGEQFLERDRSSKKPWVLGWDWGDAFSAQASYVGDGQAWSSEYGWGASGTWVNFETY